MATVLRSPTREGISNTPHPQSPEDSLRRPDPTRIADAAQAQYDVPFFTVAHYRSPISPTTYEVPVGPPLPAKTSGSPSSVTSFHDSESSQETLVGGAGDSLYNGLLDSSPLASPVEIAFGPLESTMPESPSTFCSSQMMTSSDSVKSVVSKDGQDRTPVGCLHTASGTAPNRSEHSSSIADVPTTAFRRRRHDDTPVVGCSAFTIPAPKSKPKPIPAKKPTDWKRCSLSSDGLERIPIPPTQIRLKRHSVGEQPSNTEMCPPILKAVCSSQGLNDFDIRRGIYEDAGVTVAGERLESRMSGRSCSSSSEQTPKTPRTPKSKSREPSFCLELEDDDYPKTDAEYAAILHTKILEAHHRQLLPLKEDVADWLSKLLDEKDLEEYNLMSRLDNGVIMCRLANLISRKAQEAKNKGTSTLEVPRLPYKIWPRARRGTFFARDNITNFLRFCNRLGVHDNLLFETEDLVCGNGERAVILSMLEVGRIATKWWNLEAPVLVKLERELDGEELSARSDSGYSNNSSPRDSSLTLHTANASSPTASSVIKFSRPKSAPLQTTDSVRCKVSSTIGMCRPQSSIGARPKSLIPRGPKPTPPPKPASIRSALTSLSKKRPNTFPSSRTYDRGWSGAKTTPTTPVATPTHSSRSRLPVACTPRSSGRSTPNTTPTTPTQCRKYLSSMQRSPVSSSSRSGIPRPASASDLKTPTSSATSVCSRVRQNTESPDESLRLLQIGLDTKLLNESHVMVRVGGGWDTLEHYLLRHEPTKITPFRTKTTESQAFCIRGRYCSPGKLSRLPKTPTSTSEKDRFPSLVGASTSTSNR